MAKFYFNERQAHVTFLFDYNTGQTIFTIIIDNKPATYRSMLFTIDSSLTRMDPKVPRQQPQRLGRTFNGLRFKKWLRLAIWRR